LLGKLEGDIQRFGGIFKVKKETTKQCIFLKLTLMGIEGGYILVFKSQGSAGGLPEFDSSGNK
jgi:hypothetical protein